ncbi:hypothetical protein [Saccharopolyspora cebuensis]|uniref:ABC transporter n=1 Tax=Saccharopolyspora cebuensis TaxID=418759 RepID=A0ABV4CLC5_9PSEU
MRTTTKTGLALLALLTTAACAAEPAPPPPAAPHGYVEGAEEAAEAQSRLVVAGAGTVRVLDLISEDVEEIARVDGATGLVGDGRYAYVGGPGRSVRVVDSGSWMVDHGDHVHYYRAAARDVGSFPAGRPVAAHSDTAVAAVTDETGTATLLDRAALDEGSVAPLATVPVAPGAAAVPHAGHVLAPRESGVRVLDRSGREVGSIERPCPDPRGTAVTGRGVVIGCADGALLVDEDDGALTGTKIGYPRQVAPDERAVEFRNRPGSATLAAPAGERGVWVLDVSERAWTLLPTGPVVTANAVGAGGPVLALTADGVLHGYDPGTGEEIATTRISEQPLDPALPDPAIEIDTSRAYVNDVATGTIHELDYNDSLRLAREFPLGGEVAHVVETGR